MAIKSTTKTTKAKIPAKGAKPAKETKAKETKVKEISGKYFYAVGKRKTSVAQIRLYEAGKASQGIIVNGKPSNEYFTIERMNNDVKSPLAGTGLEEKFDVMIKVSGGGITGQAEAARLGVARALVLFDETLKKALKDLGYLTRDARVVERKKPGFRKARRSPQWAKR